MSSSQPAMSTAIHVHDIGQVVCSGDVQVMEFFLFRVCFVVCRLGGVGEGTVT